MIRNKKYEKVVAEITSYFCLARKLIWPLSYLPTPPLGQDMTQGQFLSGVLQV